MKKPELVAPAGNFEKLKTALLYGADTVYCAGKEFGLRAHAGNFTDEDLAEAAALVHARGRRLYVTVNVFARNDDFETLPAYLQTLGNIGIDAIMVSDPGIVRVARETVPDLPLVLSTQANCTNLEAVRFWQEQGLQRVVLARELSMEEIRTIKNATSAELEVFIHGAICVSWSGRCFISRYLTGRDANRGDCTHSCRWEYALAESERPEEYMPLEEDARGTYFFNSRDLCLVNWLPQLMQAGVDALKIEGRMKTVSYVAATIAVYRDAIDTFAADPQAQPKEEWIRELRKVATRDLTEGFIRGHDLPEDYDPDNVSHPSPVEFCGVLEGMDGPSARIGVRNQFKQGDVLEFLLPGLKYETMAADGMYSQREKAAAEIVNPNDVCVMDLAFEAPAGTIVRRKLD